MQENCDNHSLSVKIIEATETHVDDDDDDDEESHHLVHRVAICNDFISSVAVTTFHCFPCNCNRRRHVFEVPGVVTGRLLVVSLISLPRPGVSFLATSVSLMMTSVQPGHTQSNDDNCR